MSSIGLPLFQEPEIPYQGSTPISRSASRSGAEHVRPKYAQKIARLRELWTVPMTMQDMAAQTGWPLASICSLKACLGSELEAVDTIDQDWGQGRITRRTRWRLKG